MFEKILIANRGEIAITIIRACRDLGIRTVAVCSEADKSALHTQLADECFCIGPADSAGSYLNPQALLTTAAITGAQAIHPGFGFLAENAAFARMCKKSNIKFIGPASEIIEKMGDKAQARKTAMEAGVPVVPGSPDIVSTLEEAQETAENIGYPIMVKASAGGGGRGMRIAMTSEDLPQAFQTAGAEAKACFGDNRLYLEKYVREPHHIEIQILADEHGNVIHLGERDCSIQRRNQKILEEAGSPFSNKELRAQMGKAAVDLAQYVNYSGVGTVEFLVDADQEFYFMEMNTRIQVEHPITEAITGLNLIQEQIRSAAGKKLKYKQKDIKFSGHAIECRINAEDPLNDFRPSPGIIDSLHLPGGMGVRVDSAIYQGYEVPPYYDSLIAKLIVHAPDRKQAIARMRRALTEFMVLGIETNIDFHLAILREPDFIAGKYNISYLAQKTDELLGKMNPYKKEA